MTNLKDSGHPTAKPSLSIDFNIDKDLALELQYGVTLGCVLHVRIKQAKTAATSMSQ